MINLTIQRHPNTQYLTVAECLRQNGYRHYCNGMKYLEQGLTQHARGSFTKAQRNYDRADVLSYDPDFWGEYMDALARNVAYTVMGVDYGTEEFTAIYTYMEDGQLIVRTIVDKEMYK